MGEIKKGDYVTRNSYNNDIVFCVKRIIKLSNNKKIAILKGIDIRIEADAYIEDLKIISETCKSCNNPNKKRKTGKKWARLPQ